MMEQDDDQRTMIWEKEEDEQGMMIWEEEGQEEEHEVDDLG